MCNSSIKYYFKNFYINRTNKYIVIKIFIQIKDYGLITVNITKIKILIKILLQKVACIFNFSLNLIIISEIEFKKVY